jgi:hypothetical protein
MAYEDTENAGGGSRAQFDLNSPEALEQFAPEIDPDAIEERLLPPPPSDGIHLLSFKPQEDKEGGAVYVKESDKKKGQFNCTAALSPRFVKEDGEEGQYLDIFYATTYKMEGQKTHALGTFCKLAGKPLPKLPPGQRQTLGEIKEHVELLLAEAPEGVKILAETQWVMSYKEADKNGCAMPDPKNPKYDKRVTIKGEEKIKNLQRLWAKDAVAFWAPEEEESEEDFEARKLAYIESSDSRAHLFTDPVTNDRRSVRAEVVSFKESL